MPSLSQECTIEFEVFCASCGAGLCGNCTEGRTGRRGVPFIEISPCEHCIKEALDNGYTKGYDACEQEKSNG